MTGWIQNRQLWPTANVWFLLKAMCRCHLVTSKALDTKDVYHIGRDQGQVLGGVEEERQRGGRESVVTAS